MEYLNMLLNNQLDLLQLETFCKALSILFLLIFKDLIIPIMFNRQFLIFSDESNTGLYLLVSLYYKQEVSLLIKLLN